MTQAEIKAAIWFQRDAAYSYARVDQYRNNPAHAFIAVRIQRAAAESAANARDILSSNEE